MVTRGKAGIVRPNPRYAHIAATDDVPRSVRAALRDPAWLAVMQDEYNALQQNDTWEPVCNIPVLIFC